MKRAAELKKTEQVKSGEDGTTISRLEEELKSLAIKATSQESRFHTESITTSSKEIDLKDVNLFVGERQLLQDAHLRLKEGIHYGLVGRNGTGKSSESKRGGGEG
jgi:ATP-binding cassette subfamily F protein 3